MCPFTWCFDGGTTEGWTINNAAGSGGGLWNVNNGRSTSASFSLHYGTGVGGNYNTGGTNSGTVTSPAFTVPAGGGNVSLRVWRDVETFGSGTWDEFSVTVVPAVGPAVQIYAVSRDGGTGGVFDTIVRSLNAFAGTSVQLVLTFDTGDGNFNNFEGIWVDDITIPCTTVPPGALSATQNRSFGTGNPEVDNFFPERPEPTTRELRQRRRAARDLWTGSVSDG